MKFPFPALTVLIIVTLVAGSCRKEELSPVKQLISASTIVDTLEGTFTNDTTLSDITKYILRGKVVVAAGATLTIPAGTRIETTGTTTFLCTDWFCGNYVKDEIWVMPGGKLNALGTETQPVVFSGAIQWPGILIMGNSTTNPADNSGILRYVRISGAGVLNHPDRDTINNLSKSAALILRNAGTSTQIENIFIDCKPDGTVSGIVFDGGTVNAQKLISSGPMWGFEFLNGYRGKVQYLIYYDTNLAGYSLGVHVDASAVAISNATFYVVQDGGVEFAYGTSAIVLDRLGQLRLRNSLCARGILTFLNLSFPDPSHPAESYPETEFMSIIALLNAENALSHDPNHIGIINAHNDSLNYFVFNHLSLPQFNNRSVSTLAGFGFSSGVPLGLSANSIARTGANFNGPVFSDPFFENTHGELGAVTTTSGNWTVPSPWLTFEWQ